MVHPGHHGRSYAAASSGMKPSERLVFRSQPTPFGGDCLRFCGGACGGAEGTIAGSPQAFGAPFWSYSTPSMTVPPRSGRPWRRRSTEFERCSCGVAWAACARVMPLRVGIALACGGAEAAPPAATAPAAAPAPGSGCPSGPAGTPGRGMKTGGGAFTVAPGRTLARVVPGAVAGASTSQESGKPAFTAGSAEGGLLPCPPV